MRVYRRAFWIVSMNLSLLRLFSCVHKTSEYPLSAVTWCPGPETDLGIVNTGGIPAEPKIVSYTIEYSEITLFVVGLPPDRFPVYANWGCVEICEEKLHVFTRRADIYNDGYIEECDVPIYHASLKIPDWKNELNFPHLLGDWACDLQLYFEGGGPIIEPVDLLPVMITFSEK